MDEANKMIDSDQENLETQRTETYLLSEQSILKMKRSTEDKKLQITLQNKELDDKVEYMKNGKLYDYDVKTLKVQAFLLTNVNDDK